MSRLNHKLLANLRYNSLRCQGYENVISEMYEGKKARCPLEIF